MEVSEATNYTAPLLRLIMHASRNSDLYSRFSPGAAATGCGFREQGDAIVLLSSTSTVPISADSGIPQVTPACPTPSDPETPVEACVREAAARGLLSSVHTDTSLGLALSLAQACLVHGRGALLGLDALETGPDPETPLFAARPGQVLISLPKENLDALGALAAPRGVALHCLGMVGGDRLLLSDCRQVLINIPVNELRGHHPQEAL